MKWMAARTASGAKPPVSSGLAMINEKASRVWGCAATNSFAPLQVSPSNRPRRQQGYDSGGVTGDRVEVRGDERLCTGRARYVVGW